MGTGRRHWAKRKTNPARRNKPSSLKLNLFSPHNVWNISLLIFQVPPFPQRNIVLQEKVLLAKYQDKQFLLLKRAKINCKARKQVLMKEYNRMRRQILGQRGWQEADKPKPDSRQKQKKTELPRRRRSMSNQHRMMLRY